VGRCGVARYVADEEALRHGSFSRPPWGLDRTESRSRAKEYPRQKDAEPAPPGCRPPRFNAVLRSAAERRCGRTPTRNGMARSNGPVAKCRMAPSDWSLGAPRPPNVRWPNVRSVRRKRRHTRLSSRWTPA
jgi:hypothetical protein